MSKLVFNLVSVFSLISCCHCDVLPSQYECKWCEDDLKTDAAYIVGSCFNELHSMHEDIKENTGYLNQQLDSFMPIMKTLDYGIDFWISLKQSRFSWSDLYDTIFESSFSESEHPIWIVKPSDLDKTKISLLDENTARKCGLFWNPLETKAKAQSEIQWSDNINRDKGHFNYSCYSSVYALFEALKSEIGDVYALSRSKLDERIRKQEKIIVSFRNEGLNERTWLYSADEKKCLCPRYRKCCNCEIKDAKQNIILAQENLILRQQELHTYLACIDGYKEQARLVYHEAYTEAHIPVEEFIYRPPPQKHEVNL